ncbi:MAG: hypothetical protein ABSG97_04240 [Sedimentisphaerales bacterium]|jgi:hypothetical protein
MCRIKEFARNHFSSIYESVRGLYKRHAENKRFGQWNRIISSTADKSQFSGQAEGQRIIVMSMIGNMYLTNFEMLLALALNARGANVEMVFDDAVFPLCELTTEDVVEKGQIGFCSRCVANMKSMTSRASLKIRLLSEFCDKGILESFRQRAEKVDLSRVLSYEEDGVPIGRPAVMVALRHFRKGTIGNSPKEAAVIRKYLVSAMITKYAVEKLGAEGRIALAIMSHGIYTSWEPALFAFKKAGMPVVAYDRQAGIGKYQFNWNSSPQNGDISSAWEGRWRNRKLTEVQHKEAVEYLASRETFARESAKFSKTPPKDPVVLRSELDIPTSKTALLLVSNLVWDAAAVGQDLIFNDTLEWVCKTIEIVSRYPNKLHLIVKPHPAEVMRGTKLFVAEEVCKLIPHLPSNVTILQADADVNPMSLMKAIDVGISHTSTAGFEMAALGKPVIPVSKAHYRSKGFTFDPDSFEQYASFIQNADTLKALYTDQMKELALKYMYVRAFKYQHYIPLLKESGYLNCVGYNLSAMDDLLPGRFEDFDFVCDAILKHRQDFVKD